MQLYSYFRSSAAFRVRIALHLKGLAFDTIPVHLLEGGGQQFSDAYRQRNPSSLVPTLTDGDWSVGQSLAIIEYFDEAYPDTPLLPDTPRARARVRALAQTIACDIHPLNNLRVLRYLKRSLDADDQARDDWYRHWVVLGLEALESMLSGSADTGRFCHGDTPGLADTCLVPQLYNARRYDCDLTPFPTLTRIDQACMALPAFQQAAPEAQPDAP